MNDYARSMPHLGFDPAPGDVDGTRALAKRHHQVAVELRQIAKDLKDIDLTKWQGQAADAARVRLIEHLAPALEKSASSAERLGTAASHWARRLQEFQNDADELERKAAHASQQPHDPSTRSAATVQARSAADPATFSAKSPTQDPAQELHSRYLAESRKTADETEEHAGVMEKLEPYRKVLEAVLAPLDIVAADHWIEALEKLAEVPGERLDALDEALEAVEALRDSGKPAIDELISLADLAETTGNELDAMEAFNPGWLKAAAGSLAEIRGLGATLSGLGILADTGTVIDPPDKGAMGWVDRGAAGVNGGLIAANLTMDEIPVAGEVVMIGTGVYLAGDFLYHNWTPFRHVCNDVGHVTATAAKDTAHVTENAVKDTGHAISSGWHSVKSTVGSWF